jgi:hypothetical protein
MGVNRRTFITSLAGLPAATLLIGDPAEANQGRGDGGRGAGQPAPPGSQDNSGSTTKPGDRLTGNSRDPEPSVEQLLSGPDPIKEWLSRHPMVEYKNLAIPDNTFPVRDRSNKAVFCSPLKTGSSGVRCYEMGARGPGREVEKVIEDKATDLVEKFLEKAAEMVLKVSKETAGTLAKATVEMFSGPEGASPEKEMIREVPDPRAFANHLEREANHARILP